MNRIQPTASRFSRVTLAMAGLAVSVALGTPAASASEVTESATGGATNAEVSQDCSFPTYWIGEWPPLSPIGTVWRFSHRDSFGRAHWNLFRC